MAPKTKMANLSIEEREEASKRLLKIMHDKNPDSLKDVSKKEALAVLKGDKDAVRNSMNSGLDGMKPEELMKLLMAGQDLANVRTPKMSDKRRDHYHDIVSNVPEQMRTPGRPLEELLKTDDKITPVEALTMMEHYTKGAIEPDNCKHVLSKLFLAADFRGVMKWWCLRLNEIEEKFGDSYGKLDRSEVPFGPQMKEIIGKLASFLGTYHDGPNNSSAFEIILKGLVYVSDEHLERVLDAYRIAEFLVQIGTPVDAADIMGNHGLLYAMGCNNTRMACYPILADILYRGGANVNQQNRQGHTALSLACASSVTHGEDEKRSIAVKWLLAHGANPDLPDNSGFTPRMNAQYSKVMTKLIRDEDKRRNSLPTHCKFCIYIPPKDFEPGLEPVGGGKMLFREKEPPRKLLACSKCHGAPYCSKECQKADWRHHKKHCKPVKK